MVAFIHAVTGSLFWVHESRVEEYKAAGHKPAAEAHPEAQPETKPAAKRTRKKTAKAEPAEK